MNYWLFKSEPDVYGYEHLAAMPESTDHWDGVRNYQARNLLRDEISEGDLVLFYHSRSKPPHVAGIARVVRGGYPDHTSWDPDAKYFDPKSSEEKPRWFMVDVQAVRKLERPVSLAELKDEPELAGMSVTQKGARLSIMPVTEAEFEKVLEMATRPAA
jgi:predicted RNA-binding protein with PUA-like domain